MYIQLLDSKIVVFILQLRPMLKSAAIYKEDNVYIYFTFIHINLYLFIQNNIYCDNIIL